MVTTAVQIWIQFLWNSKVWLITNSYYQYLLDLLNFRNIIMPIIHSLMKYLEQYWAAINYRKSETKTCADFIISMLKKRPQDDLSCFKSAASLEAGSPVIWQYWCAINQGERQSLKKIQHKILVKLFLFDRKSTDLKI